MAEPIEAWATWLQDQFERHPSIRRPADLAKASGLKPNGRPRIDDSRISSWLKGQRPSYDLAMAAAEAFGRPITEALAAAGYRLEAEHRGEVVVGNAEDRGVLRRSDNSGLIDALRELRRALEQQARGTEAAQRAAAAIAAELEADDE